MCIETYLEEGIKHDQMLKTYGYSLIDSIILDFYICNQYLRLFYKILRKIQKCKYLILSTRKYNLYTEYFILKYSINLQP